MDIPQKRRQKPMWKTWSLPAAMVAGVAMLWLVWQANTGQASEQSIAVEDIAIATVTRGTFVHEVAAPGTLQPVELRWIAARSQGKVEQILVQPGARVTAETVVMRLSNPELQRNAESARFALQVAEAELAALEKRLRSDALAQQAIVIDYQAQLENAQFRMEANEALSGLNVVSALEVRENALLTRQLTSRLDIEKQRLAHLKELHIAELAAKQAEVNLARSDMQLQVALAEDLDVRAGLNGILQEVPVEQGQQINSGDTLARVAREDLLMAELRVQESQVKAVRHGQAVTIRAGGQSVQGEVLRIEPAVQNGVVVVDVALTEGRLEGARPDLRVQGLIEIARLENALTLQRPVNSQEHTTHELFLLDEAGEQAHLVAVSTGQGSVDRIHILAGLQEGARVIVSDTQRFDQSNTILLQ